MPHNRPYSSQLLDERCNVIGTQYLRVLNYFFCKDYNELLTSTIAVDDIFFNLAVVCFMLIFTHRRVYIGTRTCVRCLICYIKRVVCYTTVAYRNFDGFNIYNLQDLSFGFTKYSFKFMRFQTLIYMVYLLKLKLI